MFEEPKKRASYRFLAGVKAFLTVGDKEIECQAVDLNRSGAKVEGSLSLNDGANARIALQTLSGDLRFESACRVAHVSSDETSGRTQLGLEFESPDADQTRTLESLISRVIEGMSSEALSHLTRESSIDEIREALSKLRPAHKTTLAQRALPLERSFLQHDESSQVLEALCRNPQLTLPEVVKLLRNPQLLPTTLEALSRDPRWASNEDIKITIATHPRVTFKIAERLVATLGILAIRKVIRRPGLHPAIKDKLVKSIPNKQLQSW